MKQFLTVVVIAVAIFGLYSCNKVIGKGPIVTESRTTAGFTAIRFDLPGELQLIPSEDYEIIIEAQRNIIDVIDTYIGDGELKVRVPHNTNLSSHEEIRVIVKAPSVNSLNLNGSGNVNALQTFSGVKTKLKISGSGRMTINRIETEELETVISGSGNIEVLGGATDELKVTISGSGHVNMLNATSRLATTNTSGSGSIKVFVTDELDAKISGSGDVFYKGDPVTNVVISGSGRVIKL